MGKKNNLSVVTITDEFGETREYIPFADRLVRFLEDYPPRDGWRVRHQARQAYPDRDPTFWIFEARLEDPEGRVVAEGSALRHVVQYKDYETGETAGYQRLLSFLGYPGDPSLWGFEEEDLATRGEAMVPEQVQTKVTPVPTAEADTEFPQPADTATVPEAAPGTSVIEVPADVPSAFVRRIELLAKKKGVEVPPYSNFDEAREVLAQLQQ